MAALALKNVDDFINQLRAELDKVEAQGIKIMQDAVMFAAHQLMDNTPVWSGETVINYGVMVNGSGSGGYKDPIGGFPGQPGTFFMKMGEEARRGPNEFAALTAINEVVSQQTTVLVNFTLTNYVGDDKWDLIDNGSAASDKPPRSVGGVSKLAEANTVMHFGGYFA